MRCAWGGEAVMHVQLRVLLRELSHANSESESNGG